MQQHPYGFGEELRRRRLAADLSLEQLGKRVHYSKAQLSKVERGLKRPSLELARLCDTELTADGALARLLEPAGSPMSLPSPGRDDEVWLMYLDKDGDSTLQPVKRRSLIAVGAASALSLQLGGDPLPVDTGAGTLVEASRMLFDQFRRIGQAATPRSLLSALIAQTHSLEQLARLAGPRTRNELLVLASRYAEYTGWMAQEAGDDRTALWWTDRAVQLAHGGGDDALAAYALVRRSLICLFGGDPAQATQLAEQALHSAAAPRVRGLAAQHRAQSLAVTGEHSAAMRSLDQARELLAADNARSDTPTLGASHVPDVVAMYTGWCLYELGRPGQAAELLDRETAGLSAHALRARARHGARRALAHAAAGDIDQACVITSELLSSAAAVDSATIATDLRRLARLLARHPRNVGVREVAPRLTAVLPRHS
ncbi:helix-turn-helix domain-containing protein [Streptomyces sp. WM6378]|uniref:helix-turn-helix domain-containing protein n=1 Tax=Streptomyces sp. WM6378 TaxID=1415557 RepID=UPI0006AF9E65|nr:helix-turn-helix transcriptional regulator [Streptomyces sp. WM6378]